MNEEQKLKLAKLKAERTPGQTVTLAFDDVKLSELHERMSEVQGSLVKILEREIPDPNPSLEELNNRLVELIAGFETNSRTIQAGLDDADEGKREVAEAVIRGITELKLPTPTEIPKWLEKPTAIEKLASEVSAVGQKIVGLPEKLKAGQKPEDFLPIRRVYMQGNRLAFDDSQWSSGGGGGNSVSIIHNPWESVIALNQKASVTTISSNSGALGGYMIANTNATVAYLQIFDTTGAVNVGTTTPDAVFGIPATASANVEFTNGIKINNGIKIACTTTASGNGAPTNGLDMTLLYE